jgi:hypothetical protein
MKIINKIVFSLTIIALTIIINTINLKAEETNNKIEKSQIIYAPQLSITKQDVENALNFISASYVDVAFKYQSGSNNNLVETEFFGSSKFLQGLGNLAISQDGSVDYMELQNKILLFGDLRYNSISFHGTYTLLNEELAPYFKEGLDNLFYGISFNTPILSLSYQNEHRTSLDKFSADIKASILRIDNYSFVSFVNSTDYIYQNKYIKSSNGIFLTSYTHSIGIEYTYKDLEFNNRVNITSLIYKIRL